MDYIEHLIRKWAAEDGLTTFFMMIHFSVSGELDRIWYFSADGINILSDISGTCDIEIIGFFSQIHEYTDEDERLVNQALSDGE